MNKRLLQIAGLGLWLGATIFGGVNAAYPVIRRQAVERGWINGEEVDTLYALAVSLPGPSFLNLWGAVVGRVAGLPGAVVGMVGLMAVPVLLVLGIPLLGRLPWLAARGDGIMAAALFGTAGLLAGTGLQGLRGGTGPAQLPIVGAVLALLLLGLHPTLVLLITLLGGALWARSSS